MIIYILPPLFIVIFLSLLYFVISRIKKKISVAINVPSKMPEEGFAIPLFASFSGLKGIPLVALAYNSFNPSLVLFKDHFRFKVIFTQNKRYEEIESVDVRRAFLTENIILIFKNDSSVFTANLLNKENLMKLLGYFQAKGFKLSRQAAELLDSAKNAGSSIPTQQPFPSEIRGWNWGAFLLSFVWGIGNNVPTAFLIFLPIVGLVMPFVLGLKGNEWAWKNKEWKSVDDFRKTQKIWAVAGVSFYTAFLILGIVTFVTLGMKKQTGQRALEEVISDSGATGQHQALMNKQNMISPKVRNDLSVVVLNALVKLNEELAGRLDDFAELHSKMEVWEEDQSFQPPSFPSKLFLENSLMSLKRELSGYSYRGSDTKKEIVSLADVKHIKGIIADNYWRRTVDLGKEVKEALIHLKAGQWEKKSDYETSIQARQNLVVSNVNWAADLYNGSMMLRTAIGQPR